MAIETSSKIAKQMTPYPGQCQSTKTLQYPYRATFIQCAISEQNHDKEHGLTTTMDGVTIYYTWPGEYEHEKA